MLHNFNESLASLDTQQYPRWCQRELGQVTYLHRLLWGLGPLPQTQKLHTSTQILKSETEFHSLLSCTACRITFLTRLVLLFCIYFWCSTTVTLVYSDTLEGIYKIGGNILLLFTMDYQGRAVCFPKMDLTFCTKSYLHFMLSAKNKSQITPSFPYEQVASEVYCRVFKQSKLLHKHFVFTYSHFTVWHIF